MSNAASGYCHGCGVMAETKYVSFYQNIGMLVMRLTTTVSGHFCKPCIHKNFWKTSGLTFVFGWWGVISFIITPFILMNNFFRYLFCLGMRDVSPDAAHLKLTPEVFDRIEPFAEEILQRAVSNEPIINILTDISARIGVPVPLIGLCMEEVMKHQQRS